MRCEWGIPQRHSAIPLVGDVVSVVYLPSYMSHFHRFELAVISQYMVNECQDGEHKHNYKLTKIDDNWPNTRSCWYHPENLKVLNKSLRCELSKIGKRS